MDIKLKNEILNKIKPTKNECELINNLVIKFINKLKRSANKNKFEVDFFIGGSYGKNTFLKDKFDVDIFARFNINYKNDLLSKYLEKILIDAKINYEIQKGSRDYFSYILNYKKQKIVFEIIPTKNIDQLKNFDEIENSTDVSPMHVKFLNEKIKLNLNLTDEIRLAKQFFKAKGLYGAESYINGFSGHVIDILISYYGSLSNLIENAKNWQENTFIDINNFYSNLDDALNSINKDKHSNLILVDPILKQRNAAKALSNNKYCEFILIANKIKKLTIEDFDLKIEDFSSVILEVKNFAKLNNLKYLIYKFKFTTKHKSEDIVGTKLLKLYKKIEIYFKDMGFRIFLTDFHINIKSGEVLFIYLFEKINLPNIKKIIGPKVFMSEAVNNFLKNRDYYFIEDSRVCIYEKRISHDIGEVSKLSLDEMEKILNKNIDFIKSVRRYFG